MCKFANEFAKIEPKFFANLISTTEFVMHTPIISHTQNSFPGKACSLTLFRKLLICYLRYYAKYDKLT